VKAATRARIRELAELATITIELGELSEVSDEGCTHWVSYSASLPAGVVEQPFMKNEALCEATLQAKRVAHRLISDGSLGDFVVWRRDGQDVGWLVARRSR